MTDKQADEYDLDAKLDEMLLNMRLPDPSELQSHIDSITTSSDLDEFHKEQLGRGSAIAKELKNLGRLPDDQRKEAGRRIHAVRQDLQGRVDARRQAIAVQEKASQIAAEGIDVTLDSRSYAIGSVHLIQQVIDEVSDIFVGLGYQVADGPEAELAWYNFDALNTPKDHPGRLESDTMYLDYGDPADEMLLRAHTSPVQARYMEKNEPPVYIVVPGKCYRNDTIDASHLPVFYQIEGLAVDENIQFSDLKGTLAEFARQFFGQRTRVRLRPHYFPFTEPSAEMDASCPKCDGADASCRLCGGTGWLEMLGCGMVDP
ncbi:MAG: phenylalanine--tRNA ligase subunit alpha, partial [Acidimicrobiia bacterium]|nr:phenylalanine--tRNA ligase subunit alpha [Acidimicrobiia bacterium]